MWEVWRSHKNCFSRYWNSKVHEFESTLFLKIDGFHEIGSPIWLMYLPTCVLLCPILTNVPTNPKIGRHLWTAPKPILACFFKTYNCPMVFIVASIAFIFSGIVRIMENFFFWVLNFWITARSLNGQNKAKLRLILAKDFNWKELATF